MIASCVWSSLMLLTTLVVAAPVQQGECPHLLETPPEKCQEEGAPTENPDMACLLDTDCLGLGPQARCCPVGCSTKCLAGSQLVHLFCEVDGQRYQKGDRYQDKCSMCWCGSDGQPEHCQHIPGCGEGLPQQSLLGGEVLDQDDFDPTVTEFSMDRDAAANLEQNLPKLVKSFGDIKTD